MAVKGGVYATNTPLQLAACTGGADQQFANPTSYPGVFKSPLPVTGGACITGGAVVGGNTPIGVNTCSSASPNWVFTPNA